MMRRKASKACSSLGLMLKNPIQVVRQIAF